MTSTERPDAAGHGVLAVDLGGTRLRVAVFDDAGEMRAHTVAPTPPDDPGALTEAMRAAIAASPVTLDGAVVGIAGPLSYAEGLSLKMPNLPRWEGHISAQGLADATRLPVVLANDADLGALGEHRFGAGRGVDDMVYVTVSTGIGAGVILNGRLLHGRRSLAEIGHTTIDRQTGDTVEQLGSGTALGRIAGIDGAEVTRRARAGDREALASFSEVAGALAIGVMNLVLCFMPQRVVIGGGVSQSGDLLLDPIRARIAAGSSGVATQPEVVIASGGDDVGLLGGLALWHDLTTGQDSSLSPAQPSH